MIISFINGTKRNKLKNIFRYTYIICIEIDIQYVNNILEEQKKVKAVDNGAGGDSAGLPKEMTQTQSMFSNKLLESYNRDIINSMFKKDEFYLFTMECMEMIAGVSEIKDSGSFSIADMKLKEARIDKIKKMDISNEKHRKKLYD